MKAFQFAVAVVVVQLANSPASAQNAAAAPAAPQGAAAIIADVVPLKVVVTLSRFDGDRRLSSLPYTLSINANAIGGRESMANLRMGAQVPVPNVAFPPQVQGKDAAVKPMTSFSYKDVGTNIDLVVRRLDSERFHLSVTVNDTSVVEDKTKTAPTPSFRQYSSSNQVVLKDGQSAQFSTAPDKVTGEVVKIDVSLNIVR